MDLLTHLAAWFLTWLLVATAAGVLIGSVIALADRREADRAAEADDDTDLIVLPRAWWA